MSVRIRDDSEAEQHHPMMATESVASGLVFWAGRKAYDVFLGGVNSQDWAILASSLCVLGLGAVAGAGAVAGRAFHAFTPTPPLSGIDKLIDALSKIGAETPIQRLTRRATMAYQGVLGAVIARTLYVLHNAGAAEMRGLLQQRHDREMGLESAYRTSSGAPINAYYDVNGEDEPTILTMNGWSVASLPRAVMNIMFGVGVYILHMVGASGESGDTTAIIDKALKIICYEEVLCRLLKLHGYGVVSQASYAVTWMLHTDQFPWHTKGKIGSGISKGLAKVHSLVGGGAN